jgi:O-antigen/teichoic acid export membrane protein
MGKSPSVKKNYIYKLLYEILTIIIPFITTPYVSRVLGADGIGVYSYTSSYMTYFTLFAALGTASYGMREIARSRDDKQEYSKKFWEIELLTVFTTMICLCGWLIVICCSSAYRIYFICLTPLLLATMFDISWFYTGHEKVGYTVFWNAICKVVGTICIFVFVKDKDDLVLYILIQTLILMLGNFSMWVFLPKMLVKVDCRTFRFRNHFKETLVYFIPTIATSIYTVLDKTLIGAITQDEFQNGYYEQATKIINLAKTVVFVAVNSVMGARISYLFANNKIEEIKQRIGLSMNFILLLGYGAMFGIIAVAMDFVPLFFGEGYEPVVYLLYMMSPLIIIIGISNCLGLQYYTPSGRRGQSAKYIIIGSVVNLVLNVILIPFIGSYGAVIASIIAELIISVLYLMKCNEYMTLRLILKYSYKRIIAGALMLLVIYLFRSINMNDIILVVMEVLIGICVYFVTLLLMKDDMIWYFIKKIKRKLTKNG